MIARRSSPIAEDFGRFRGLLAHAAPRYGIAVHAYVLMTNHVHVLATPRSARPACLRRCIGLGCVFAQYLNTKYQRTGSRFEGRYRAAIVHDETLPLDLHALHRTQPGARRHRGESGGLPLVQLSIKRPRGNRRADRATSEFPRLGKRPARTAFRVSRVVSGGRLRPGSALDTQGNPEWLGDWGRRVPSAHLEALPTCCAVARSSRSYPRVLHLAGPIDPSCRAVGRRRAITLAVPFNNTRGGKWAAMRVQAALG